MVYNFDVSKGGNAKKEVVMDPNLTFFIENFEILLKEHRDKFIVIKNQAVIASYETFDEAYAETIKTEELGSFIIQYCVPEAMEPDMSRAWSRITFTQVPV